MKSYSFSEYKKMQELSNIERLLGELKKNKEQYARLVFIIAVFTPKVVLATSNDLGLGPVADEIIHMIIVFGKYGCLGKGTMNMINEMLQGANLKEALGEGMSYFIFYIVLNIYPRIFDMLRF